MLWWFLILASSSALVLWAGIAVFLRVRRHTKASAGTKRGAGHEADTL
jgi:hypothetical protein